MFHIGVDIGGTFTDCVLVGEGTDGAVTYRTAKTLSTRADPAQGVRGTSRPALLREYLCPLTGLRLATELIRSGDDPAADMVLAG